VIVHVGSIDPSREPLPSRLRASRVKERFLHSASQPFAPFEAQGKGANGKKKLARSPSPRTLRASGRNDGVWKVQAATKGGEDRDEPHMNDGSRKGQRQKRRMQRGACGTSRHKPESTDRDELRINDGARKR
jgi:hypothetical protein